MSDSQLNRASISKSTKREEYHFLNTMHHFWHNVWIGFKKYCVAILLFSIVVTSAVYLYCKSSYTPRYESSITFLAKPLISSTSSDYKNVFKYNNNIIMDSQLSVTFPHIFHSGILREIVQSELGTEIDAQINARSVAGTNYFTVTVNSNTPENAKNIADCLMKNYPKVSEAVLGDVGTEIKIPSKLPTAPCNRNDYKVSTLCAFAMSMVLCVFFLCIYSINRKTVCSKDDVKYVLNQPYICEIPLVKEKSNSKNRFKSIIKNKSFTESMRTIKSRILGTLTDNKYKTIGIVSTTNDEGKTTTAAGLAKILSSKTESTILVTFDHATVPHMEGVLKRKDISTIFLMKKGAADKVSAPVAGTKKLFNNVDLLVLPSKIVSDKKTTSDIFETLKQNYAYVIIDIVPGDSHSESLSLINYCDAYIPVIRCDCVPTYKIKNTLNYFSYSKARNLGVILNGVSSTYISYGRYSNYGKYRKYAYGYNYYSYGKYGEDSLN